MTLDKKYEISVAAESKYLADQSDEPAGRFVFAYTITLRNTGSVAAQLVSRHWIITDGNNHVQEVRGLGVVGEQPLLAPGESFQYSSGAAIATAVGTMRGTYQMLADDGTQLRRADPRVHAFHPAHAALTQKGLAAVATSSPEFGEHEGREPGHDPAYPEAGNMRLTCASSTTR